MVRAMVMAKVSAMVNVITCCFVLGLHNLHKSTQVRTMVMVRVKESLGIRLWLGLNSYV